MVLTGFLAGMLIANFFSGLIASMICMIGGAWVGAWLGSVFNSGRRDYPDFAKMLYWRRAWLYTFALLISYGAAYIMKEITHDRFLTVMTATVLFPLVLCWRRIFIVPPHSVMYFCPFLLWV